MTRQTQKRCSHCGSHYVYTTSGSGSGWHDNKQSDTWCLSCVSVVQAALKTVPRKFEIRYRDVAEAAADRPDGARLNATLETLLRWETARRAEQGMFVQRIWPGLIDTPSADVQRIREIRDPDTNQPFRLSTWSKRSDYKIEIAMVYDLINDCWTSELA